VEALAGLAISVVGPYIAKGAEKFAQEVGSQAFDAVKLVADRLRTWWAGEPVAAAAANSLASDPQKYSTILTELLASDLAKDDAFAAELRTLMDRVGPHVEVIQRIEIAKGVTGADVDRLVAGSVHVEQDVKEGQDVTGFRAGTVGG
jgi:hypothetical protein